MRGFLSHNMRLTRPNNYDSTCLRFLRMRGGVAQLVERLLCKQDVAGSIPVTSTIFPDISYHCVRDADKTISVVTSAVAEYIESMLRRAANDNWVIMQEVM